MTQNEHFASIDMNAARSFATSASALIRSGSKESPLRHLLSTSLPQMFPGDHWWIELQATGAESNATFRERSKNHHGFIDTLVGKTAVEYEKNLRNADIYREGFKQVKEYCASLLNDGIPPEDVFGVLSDTVRWYAYTLRVTDKDRDGLWGPDEVELIECQFVDLSSFEEASFQEFEQFVNRYFGRLGARRLNADALVSDFGNRSNTCRELLPNLVDYINQARLNSSAEGGLAFKLWVQFHSVVGSDSQSFDVRDFAYDLYLVTLAKLTCANLIDQNAPLRSREELLGILNGEFFNQKGLINIVDHDCFYWLTTQEDCTLLLEVATSIQRDLAVYDFAIVEPEDLFGRLISQLSADKKRILLGQEPTPKWLAAKMVKNCEEGLAENESPTFLDMCCGSGVFVVEVIKRMLERFNHPIMLSEPQKNAILSSITGFDIDPVSVLFAKVNWVLSLKDHILDFSDGTRIPIYQADSLFSSPPGGSISVDDLTITFDGHSICLPAKLINPEYVVLYDELVISCQELAHSDCVDAQRAVTRALSRCAVDQEAIDLADLSTFSKDIIEAFRTYGDSRILDIWSFVIRNCYKPRMLEGCFNGVVSNPPWLSMSKLAKNPYTEALKRRADRFGIKPPAMSFLHLELATVFLLTSCKRYLKDDSRMLCIIPTTVLNGFHQEPFRLESYRDAPSPVDFKINSIWTLPENTFKNKAVVLIGSNSVDMNEYPIPGVEIDFAGDKNLVFSLVFQGNRSAWSTKTGRNAVIDSVDPLPFSQGADLMPRTFVFYEAQEQPNKKFTLRSIPKLGHPLSYLVSDAKKAKEFSLSDVANIPNKCLYSCFISKQIMPFHVSSPALGFLPIKPSAAGYQLMSNNDLEDAGRGVKLIVDKAMSYSDNGMPAYGSLNSFFEKVNVYNKLSRQGAWSTSWFVVYGAGGQDVAAAIVNLDEISSKQVVFDQTIYWMSATDYDEALFYAALFNSESLNNIIKEFQPEGEFGKRHIHKLPPAVVPRFDRDNPQHQDVVSRAAILLNEINQKISQESSFEKLTNPAEGALQVRRRKFREAMKEMASYADYAKACSLAMGL